MIKLAGNLKHFTGDTMAVEFGTLKKLDGYVYLLDSQWHCTHCTAGAAAAAHTAAAYVRRRRTGGDAPIRKETRASLHFSAAENDRRRPGHL